MKKPYTVEKLELQKGRDWWTIAGPCGSTYPAMDHATAMDLCDRLNGAYSACLREGAQGIVKEGPSVEAIETLARTWWKERRLNLVSLAKREGVIPANDYELEADLVAFGRHLLSALFTQTQVEPEIIRAGNAMRDTIASICRQLIHGSVTIERADMDKLLGEWGAWDRAVAAQGIGGAAESRSDEGGRERSGPPQSPVAEERSDAPKNNEEQSEDAALPDGRSVPLTDENINTIASFIAGQPDRNGYHNRFDAAKKGLELYRDHLT